MYIKFDKKDKKDKNVVNLNESEENIIETGIINQQLIDSMNNTDFEVEIISEKNMQLKLECGVFFARINNDVNSVFGLKYHFLKSNNDFDNFLLSLKESISVVLNVTVDDFNFSSTDLTELWNEFKQGLKLY